MEREVYCRLIQELNLPISAIPHFQLIAQRFNVSADTVYSIYHQEITARILKRHHLLRAAGGAYAQRYLQGADLLQLCYEVDLPPCTVVRVVVERLPLGIPPNRLTTLLRQPSLLPALASAEAWAAHCQEAAAVGGGSNTSSSSSDSTSRQAALAAFLARLQRDIELCIECDGCSSPAADLSRHSAGREYEAKLYERLTAAGIAYWTEDDLREKGFHKTPDAKLQVPIAVQGRIVNWIDSKATFGDDKTHREQALGQYQKYVNRYGPGLVIYWHGYIRDLASLEGGEDVLLLERFPQPLEVVTLPRLPLGLAAAEPVAAAAAAAGLAAAAAAAAGGVAAAAPAAAAAEPAVRAAGAQEAPGRLGAEGFAASAPREQAVAAG